MPSDCTLTAAAAVHPPQRRPYQQNAIAALRDAYATGARAPLLVMPTGAGKTVVFCSITASANGRSRRVLIVAHRRELIRQASAKLTDAGVPHGLIAPWAPRTDAAIQVGSIQTLVNRLGRLPQFDLLILDEGHHARAEQWRKLLKAQPQAKVLGITATPERGDGRGLGVEAGGVYDRLVLGPSVVELIEGGYLVGTRTFAPAIGPDLSKVRTVAGDYAVDDLADAMNRPAITGNAMTHYARHAPGLPAIAFCVSVQHAKDVAAAFVEAGWRATAAFGDMPTAERDAALAGLADGSVQVLCTCDLVSEGIDVPVVGCVILLRPTQSLGLFMQQAGRGLRPAEGKVRLVILDHAGNTRKHGMIESPREWSLADRPKRKAQADETIHCPLCDTVHARAPACPECGHVHYVVSEVRDSSRELIVRDGALEEIDARSAHIHRLRTAPLYSILRGNETEAELRQIASLRNYRSGWIWHTLKQQQAQRA